MMPEPRRVLLLFSDTGGGHRSAAEAIREALVARYGAAVAVSLVDFFVGYAPPPLNRAPALYPYLVRVPAVWEASYRLTDGPRRAQALSIGLWPYVRPAARRLFAEHPADLIVSVHPLINGPALRALGTSRPPFVVVVTDLVTTHAFWYHPQADLTVVPTPEAAAQARRYGLPPERVQVIGLPVAARCCEPVGDRAALRARLGWPAEGPAVLLVGGGEGMGPLETIAEALAAARLPITLIVVAGRNRALRERLQRRRWPIPVRVYGFVQRMPDFMRAADVLITKAGPGTICEALNAHLPMILYSRLPGQEDGNVDYVVRHGAGLWAPEPAQVVAALRAWLQRPEEIRARRAACRRLARPEAARQIAALLGRQLGWEA